MKFGLFLTLIATVLSYHPSCSQAASAGRINVVFILADDLGWADLGCYGSSFYETPNLDALAKDGMKFTRAYAAAPVCSPTRASLLTGKFPLRTGITDYINESRSNQPEAWARTTELLPAGYSDRLPPNETTIAQALKAAGYKTYFAGKWHLGPEKHWPENHGFDINKGGYTAGQPKSYFSPYGNPVLTNGENGEYLPERLASETANFIRQSKNEPFFVYHALYLAHTPLKAREDLIKKYEAKKARLGLKDGLGKEGSSDVRIIQSFPVYAAMVEASDNVVGKIVKTLKEEGLYDNTLIVFTSDNGGLSTSEGRPTSNLPLRAGKGWMYEGGIREPLIIRLPGITKPGSVNHSLVSSPDFYPTILNITKTPLIPSQHVDGKVISKTLTGKKLKNRTLYWHYPHYGNQGGKPSSCIMEGDWKLIKWYKRNAALYELYNVQNDIGEKDELSSRYPKKVASMKKKLEEFLSKADAIYPVTNPNFK